MKEILVQRGSWQETLQKSTRIQRINTELVKTMFEEENDVSFFLIVLACTKKSMCSFSSVYIFKNDRIHDVSLVRWNSNQTSTRAHHLSISKKERTINIGVFFKASQGTWSALHSNQRRRREKRHKRFSVSIDVYFVLEEKNRGKGREENQISEG